MKTGVEIMKNGSESRWQYEIWEKASGDEVSGGSRGWICASPGDEKRTRPPWIKSCHGNSDRLALGAGVAKKVHKTMAAV